MTTTRVPTGIGCWLFLPALLATTFVVAVGTAFSANAQSTAPNISPPATTTKLVFVHHSVGENWLTDGNGDLGLALRDNNYFVSDTNYGWGPADADTGTDRIGEHTDIGHWFSWFVGPNRNTYVAALYAEGGQNSSYSRLPSDPGGENRIVLFKSCFTNSSLVGSPDDPVPPIASNPLRGREYESEAQTIANAKGIYTSLLSYFATRTDKLFVAVTAPPRGSAETDPDTAAVVRAFNQWLVGEWLRGYPHRNVVVYDFYNVLTSNGGSTRTNDPETNDLGRADGNHHRIRNGALEHLRTVAHDMSAYAVGGDSHPTRAGGLKASGEFPAFLNTAYHCWQGDGGCPFGSSGTATCTVSCTASAPSSAIVSEAGSFSATATATDCSGSPSFVWDFGDGSATASTQSATHSYAEPGTYAWTLTVTVDGQTCRRNGSVAVTAGGATGSHVYVVPAVAHSAGAMGSLWRTDVAVVNRASASTRLQVTFVPVGGAATVRSATLAALSTTEWSDVLVSMFGHGSASSVSGALAVSSDQPLFVSSRTFNQGATGTFGGYLPGVAVTSALTFGEMGCLPHLKKNASFRTNIGVVNLGTSTATVLIRLYGSGGQQVGSDRRVTVAAGALVQESDVFALAGAGNHEIAYAGIDVETPGGAVWAFASVIDNPTGDPTMIPLAIP